MAPLNPESSQRLLRTLDEYHLLVGRIASGWAFLEHEIDQTIWKLAEVEPALGACITTQLTGISARLRTLSALLSLREGSDDLLKKIKKFSGKNYPVLERRNRAVHDAWSITEEGEVAQIRVALVAGQLKLDAVVVSTQELTDTLKLVGAQMRAFNRIHQEMVVWLEASPKRWREPLPQISLGDLVSSIP